MTIETPEQLAVAREKLAILEARCDEMRAAEPLSLTKSLTLRSLCHLAKQLKEQIARYQSRQTSSSDDATAIRGIQSAEQWRNTRTKLELLEARCGEIPVTDTMTRSEELTWQSLKRTVNQLTEELVRYSAHHPEEVGVFKIPPPHDRRAASKPGGLRASTTPNV